jgi:hypothetical protein
MTAQAPSFPSGASLAMSTAVYEERFDDGPGGWVRVQGNAQPMSALPVGDGAVWSWGPWWIDYNHAPPGAGYLQLLMCLHTKGPFGEHLTEIGGVNRFVAGGFPLDLRNATLTARLRGELELAGAKACVLVQGMYQGKCCGAVLTGRPIEIRPDYSEQSVVLTPSAELWTPLGARVGREDMYGIAPIATLLERVDVNLYLVLFGFQPRPMGPLDGDPHRLRAGRDYPVWPASIPQGYVAVDTVRIAFAE